jgi:hypothetical protein
MSTNLERFKKDLEKLMATGHNPSLQPTRYGLRPSRAAELQR